MLKRIFVFVLVLFVFTGCEKADYTNNNSIDVSSVSSTSSEPEVPEYYDTDKPFDLELSESQNIVDLEEYDIHINIDPINTKEDAYVEGEEIIKQFQDSGYLIGYEMVYVCHYNQDNLWRFEYFPTDDEYLHSSYYCGLMSIVIHGDTGDVNIGNTGR